MLTAKAISHGFCDDRYPQSIADNKVKNTVTPVSFQYGRVSIQAIVSPIDNASIKEIINCFFILLFSFFLLWLSFPFSN